MAEVCTSETSVPTCTVLYLFLLTTLSGTLTVYRPKLGRLVSELRIGNEVKGRGRGLFKVIFL